jgi:Tol biopolymer transport system component
MNAAILAVALMRLKLDTTPAGAARRPHVIDCALAFAALALWLYGARLGAEPAAVNKTKVESLTSIPSQAELVCESTQAGEKSEFGYPANELYVADSAGGHLTRVTHNQRLYNHFAVSPNRKMIAANRYDHGDTNKNGKVEAFDRKTLWVIDLEHKQEWPLVPDTDAGWGGIDWTPDGEYIVTGMTVNNAIDIFRIRPDGTGLENLTKNLNKLLAVDDTQKNVTDVSTSFDGKWITFLYSNKRMGASRIAMMRMDGSEARFVTDPRGVKSAGGVWHAGDYDPEFSPDGQYITFERTTDKHLGASGSTSMDIMRIRIDGTEVKDLSPAGNQGVSGIPDWSADDRIVFSEWNEVDRWMGTVIVNGDGSNYHRVEKLKGCTHVRWIPKAQ